MYICLCRCLRIYLLYNYTQSHFQHFPDCNVHYLEYVGDGDCHDFLNTNSCNFDGGDCCSPGVRDSDCHEEVANSSLITTPNTSNILR